MQHSPEIDQLATALAAAQGELGTVIKDGENPHFRSKFASLAAVVQAAHPITSKHGLAVIQTLGTAETSGGLIDTVTTLLTHKSGQWLSDTMRLYLVKDDPQGQGSATTYGRRYAHMAILGLAPEDDDGNAASNKAPARGHNDTHPATASRKRPPPQVTEISPKRRLLQACGGDKEMAERLWEEAFGVLGTESPEKGLTEQELQLLLSRAQAEAAK